MGHLGAILSPLGQKPEKDPKKDPKDSPKPIDFGDQNWHFFVNFGVIFWTTFWSLFGPLLGPILDPFWDQIGPRRGQDEPKRAIKSFKDQKSYIFKKVVFASDCLHFFTLEASQESLKRPKKAPKRHPKRSKTPKKEIQNWTQKLTNFGPILVFKMGCKSIPQN